MPTQTKRQPAKPANQRETQPKGEVTKVGNLTKDLELAFGANGTAYARAGLAVDRPKIPGDWSGERVTEFYDITVFGDMAENAAMSLPKGTRVIVQGRAEVEQYTKKDGTTGTGKRILVNAIGPDLRWASCEVSKVTRRGPAGDNQAEIPFDEEPF